MVVPRIPIGTTCRHAHRARTSCSRRTLCAARATVASSRLADSSAQQANLSGFPVVGILVRILGKGCSATLVFWEFCAYFQRQEFRFNESPAITKTPSRPFFPRVEKGSESALWVLLGTCHHWQGVREGRLNRSSYPQLSATTQKPKCRRNHARRD